MWLSTFGQKIRREALLPTVPWGPDSCTRALDQPVAQHGVGQRSEDVHLQGAQWPSLLIDLGTTVFSNRQLVSIPIAVGLDAWP